MEIHDRALRGAFMCSVIALGACCPERVDHVEQTDCATEGGETATPLTETERRQWLHELFWRGLRAAHVEVRDDAAAVRLAGFVDAVADEVDAGRIARRDAEAIVRRLVDESISHEQSSSTLGSFALAMDEVRTLLCSVRAWMCPVYLICDRVPNERCASDHGDDGGTD